VRKRLFRAIFTILNVCQDRLGTNIREISKKRARFFRSDPKLVAMERAYPGLSVADFIVGVWQELQRYNSSGGYTVEIPWHAKLERELTPVEVTEILMRGKGGKASKKKRR